MATKITVVQVPEDVLNILKRKASDNGWSVSKLVAKHICEKGKSNGKKKRKKTKGKSN